MRIFRSNFYKLQVIIQLQIDQEKDLLLIKFFELIDCIVYYRLVTQDIKREMKIYEVWNRLRNRKRKFMETRVGNKEEKYENT